MTRIVLFISLLFLSFTNHAVGFNSIECTKNGLKSFTVNITELDKQIFSHFIITGYDINNGEKIDMDQKIVGIQQTGIFTNYTDIENKKEYSFYILPYNIHSDQKIFLVSGQCDGEEKNIDYYSKVE
jgi:hypothetical protein